MRGCGELHPMGQIDTSALLTRLFGCHPAFFPANETKKLQLAARLPQGVFESVTTAIEGERVSHPDPANLFTSLANEDVGQCLGYQVASRQVQLFRVTAHPPNDDASYPFAWNAKVCRNADSSFTNLITVQHVGDPRDISDTALMEFRDIVQALFQERGPALVHRRRVLSICAGEYPQHQHDKAGSELLDHFETSMIFGSLYHPSE
jgi:hypothetical protein